MCQKPFFILLKLIPFKRHTIELCQRAEKAGADWISVHGRTPKERKEPVHYDIIKLVSQDFFYIWLRYSRSRSVISLNFFCVYCMCMSFELLI